MSFWGDPGESWLFSLLFCAVASPSLNEIVFQDVQAAHHLGEDKHPVATSLQLWQQLVNQHQLASSLDHCLELKIWRLCIVRFFKLFQNFLFSTCRDWTAWCEYREGFYYRKQWICFPNPQQTGKTRRAHSRSGAGSHLLHSKLDPDTTTGLRTGPGF